MCCTGRKRLFALFYEIREERQINSSEKRYKVRYRRPKHYREKLKREEEFYYIESPELYKGRWRQFSKEQGRLLLEIGMGRGSFLHEMAQRHRQDFFLGMEKLEALLIQSCERARENGIENLRFLGADASNLREYFEEDEVDGIYLNFSDPWKKSRQAKRRLTHIDYLQTYSAISKNGAFLHFKTDNRELFDFSVESLKHSDYEIEYLSFDLHADASRKDNVQTEYEKNFSSQGIPICKAECRLKK